MMDHGWCEGTRKARLYLADDVLSQAAICSLMELSGSEEIMVCRVSETHTMGTN